MQEMNALEGRPSTLGEAANGNSERRMMLENELHIARDRLAMVHSPSAQMQNQKVAALDQQIQQQENSIAAMKERYTEDYPDLQAGKTQLEFLKKQRDAAAKEKPPKNEMPLDNSLVTRDRLDGQESIDRIQTQMKANAMDAAQINRDMARSTGRSGIIKAVSRECRPMKKNIPICCATTISPSSAIWTPT